MSKITLHNYEKQNELALEKYFSNQYSLLNEYFYIQETELITDMLDNIKNYKHIPEEQLAHFLTGFFFNQQKSEYSVAENIGKFILRLSSFKDENTLIEIKQLSLEEKINFLHNINKITQENKYLSDMFNLNGQRFSDKISNLLENRNVLDNIKALYCNDWLDYNDVLRTINQEKIFMKNIDLNIKLSNKLKPTKNIKRHKI